MNKILIIILLFSSLSFAQDHIPDVRKKVIYIDTTFQKLIENEPTKIDWLEGAKDFGLTIAGAYAFSWLDKLAYPYTTNKIATQLLFDIVIGGALYKLSGGKLKVVIGYGILREFALADEMYYWNHGLQGNSKYGGNFDNGGASHFWWTPIGLFKDKVTYEEHIFQVTLGTSLNFILQMFINNTKDYEDYWKDKISKRLKQNEFEL